MKRKFEMVWPGSPIASIYFFRNVRIDLHCILVQNLSLFKFTNIQKKKKISFLRRHSPLHFLPPLISWRHRAPRSGDPRLRQPQPLPQCPPPLPRRPPPPLRPHTLPRRPPPPHPPRSMHIPPSHQ